jgi:sulfur carrier protein ThiS
MTAAPEPTPVTTPLADTTAAAVSDEVHVAKLVTSSVVPEDNVAVAVNCEVAPTGGAVPATAIVAIELAAVVELPHPAKPADKTTRTLNTTIDRTFILTPDALALLHWTQSACRARVQNVAEVLSSGDKSAVLMSAFARAPRSFT